MGNSGSLREQHRQVLTLAVVVCYCNFHGLISALPYIYPIIANTDCAYFDDPKGHIIFKR